MNKKVVLSCLAVFLACAGSAEAAWIATWAASPLPPTEANGPFPASPSFENQTVRQIVRVSASGDRVRLRLSNEHGSRPLEIGAARIGLADPDGDASDRGTAVTFGGKASAVIPAGAPLLSDPIELQVDELDTLSISLYFPGETGPCTCHATGMQAAYVSAPGDFTSEEFDAAETIQARAFLSGVEVETDEPAGVVVALGDSITDGVGSTPGANHRWPDLLAERLATLDGAGTWGVANAGISGNRVLSDGAGESALARFDRDVLAVPGVTHVVVFEGVNDVGIGFGRLGGPLAGRAGGTSIEPSADAMIAGYRQLIARAHSKGLEIYGATIAPYEGASYWSEEGEAVRQAVNAWIRDGGEFDAVLDFDAVLRDPEHPSQMAEGMHSGDHLHGSDAGYRKIADSIDLALFR